VLYVTAIKKMLTCVEGARVLSVVSGDRIVKS